MSPPKRGADVVLGASRADRRRFFARVGAGLAVGALYAALDAWLDIRLMSGAGTRFRWMALLHEVVDLVLPIVAGGAMGLAVHYLRLRADAVAEERRRAEDLRGDLHKIERDQAVWVVAASLLHELRNPLHALGLLLDELAALPADATEDRRALMERARAQHDRVTAELSALRSMPATQTPELPRVDLSAITRRFVGEMAALLGDGPLRVVLRAPVPVLADADATYVQIIVQNVVENALDAIRDRGGGGVVEVEVIHEAARAMVRVRDDGPGLDDDAAQSIFEPLRTSKARGMGLGLSIARALARAMGGDLALERARPATFRLELCPAAR